ncbi:TraB/GumN family protein [Luteolibacter yonseiensis]|uniref:TraB/GumN family protein n=1 Tax=Luteolibacter yonseiensis TaxID=1144680 RepID=A0A934VA73_9BACT|nr:TraB/GumN family protein [Luteolibacter yonseiensis]MBK1815918.1 TraB/GumN family protein [Luteolibacter yonseiensis]
MSRSAKKPPMTAAGHLEGERPPEIRRGFVGGRGGRGLFSSHSLRAVRMSLVMVLTLGGIAGSSLAAAPEHPVKPLLWKVEGDGLKQPSYLFGTIHLSVPPVGTLHPAAETAFKAADVVCTEIPLDTATQMEIVPMLMRKDGKTLDESIGDKLAKELNDELKQVNPQLDSTPFQSLKTWGVAVTVPMLPYQLKGEQPLDAKIWERATKEGKATGSLETVASQLKLFEDFTEAEQTSMLGDVLKQLREDREAGTDATASLIAAYVSGDEKRVLDEVNKSMQRSAEGENKELGERFMKRFLTDRDAAIASVIDEKLKGSPDKTHFFAVGAAHLTGKPGIPGQLITKGYRITRITE